MGRGFGGGGRGFGRGFGRGPGGGFPGRGFMRPGMGRAPLGPRAQQQLMQANRLILGGEAIQAALIFASVAALAHKNGMPARSANLTSRAALAYFEANDVEHGKEFALKAVQKSLTAGNVNQAVRIAQQVLVQLKARGLTEVGDELRAQFDALLKPFGITLADPGTAQPLQKKKLPAQCPSCLGPVRPDAVDWIDDHTAECAYCGSILQAE